ncbi:MAG: hypothetical protein V6Z82_04575 [Flavobacteriales bacterium]
MSRKNRSAKTPKYVDDMADASDDGNSNDELQEIKKVELVELDATLRGEAIDDSCHEDFAAREKYNSERQNRISSEVKEAELEVQRMRNNKRKKVDVDLTANEPEKTIHVKSRDSADFKSLLQEERRKAEQLKDADFLDALFRCPLCFNPMASKTNDDGKTGWWCPSKCLLPWTADEKKPALYAELRVRVLEDFQNPNPVPYCEIHDEPCKLEVVNKEKCKDERLANKLFFTCARKNDEGRCSFVKSAEFHGEKGEAFALMFNNRKRKIERMEAVNVQAANFAYEAALKRARAEILKGNEL